MRKCDEETSRKDYIRRKLDGDMRRLLDMGETTIRKHVRCYLFRCVSFL